MCPSGERAFVVALLVLFTLLASGVFADGTQMCAPITNMHTQLEVNPFTWPEATLLLTNAGGFGPNIRFRFGWCNMLPVVTSTSGSAPEHGDTCPTQGFLQAWIQGGDSECVLSCDALSRAPHMSVKGENEVDTIFSCPSSDFFVQVHVSCDGATSNDFSGSVYSTAGPNNYIIKLTSKVACGTAAAAAASGPFTPASAFIVIVFAGFGLYFIIGTLVMGVAKGKRGLDMIPHRAFWADFPFLIKDGFVFVFDKLTSCCRKGAGNRASGTYNTVR